MVARCGAPSALADGGSRAFTHAAVAHTAAMPVIEAQQFRMRQVLPPTAALLATAVVRVYTARQRPAGDGRAAWTYAGLSGALGVVYYAACKALCFRLWEVDGPRVLFEFEAYVAVHALGARCGWVLLHGVRTPLTALRARPGMRAWAIDGSPHGSTHSLPRMTSRWGSHSPVERTRIVCLPRYAAAVWHHTTCPARYSLLRRVHVCCRRAPSSPLRRHHRSSPWTCELRR